MALTFGVGPDVPGPVLFEHEARQDAIQDLLSLVADRLSSDEFSF